VAVGVQKSQIETTRYGIINSDVSPGNRILVNLMVGYTSSLLIILYLSHFSKLPLEIVKAGDHLLVRISKQIVPASLLIYGP